MPKKTTTPKASPAGDLTRPGRFDINAWAAGKAKITSKTKITNRPDLAAEIEKLVSEKSEIQLAMGQVEGTTRSPRRMAEKDERAQRIRDIDAAIDELLPQMDGSWLEVQFRPLEPTEQDKLRAARRKPGVDLGCATFEIVGQVRPAGGDDEDWQKLSYDQWQALVATIGIPQFQTLDRLSGGLSYGMAVTPDFFEQLSPLRRTGTSSGS